MIIEGVMPKWLVAEVQKGTPWDHISIRNPDQADEESIAVLVVPIDARSVAKAKARIEKALE